MNKTALYGSFDNSSQQTKEYIMEVVSMYHHRDGKTHEDGSRGTIVITPKELNDLLSYMLASSAK